MGKKTYVIVGLGGRYALFRDAITGEFKNNCQLLALCDRNRGSLQKSLQETGERAGYSVKGYHSEDYDQMLNDLKPDCVIVTAMDSIHDEYICRSMELGCDVITENQLQ